MFSSGSSSSNSEPAPECNPAPSAADFVLLVEDEDSLGELLVQLLGRSGIRAVRTADGATALQTFMRRRAEVSLAFVDCRLPDMDGGDLCRELRRLAPGLPLLLTSGRDQRTLLAALSSGGSTVFLQKPYMPGEVVRQVNALLSRTG